MQNSLRHCACALLCCFFLLGKNAALATSPAPVAPPDTILRHRALLQVGLALHYGDLVPYRMSQFSGSWASSRFVQWGLHYGRVFYDGKPFPFVNRDILKGGQELAVFAKFFFYHPLKSRRSNVYVGLDVRAGQRRFVHFDEFQRPEYAYRSRSFAGMVRFGWQKRFGRCVFELASPVGLEYSDLGLDSGVTLGEGDDGFHPVVMPLLSLGYRL
jgi:hypothetical protein